MSPIIFSSFLTFISSSFRLEERGGFLGFIFDPGKVIVPLLQGKYIVIVDAFAKVSFQVRNLLR